jgi:hypothetical protein
VASGRVQVWLSMQHPALQQGCPASAVQGWGRCPKREPVRAQDCEPLWLTDAEGTRFAFGGARAIAAGTLAPEAAFVAPDAVGTGAVLPPNKASLIVPAHSHQILLMGIPLGQCLPLLFVPLAYCSVVSAWHGAGCEEQYSTYGGALPQTGTAGWCCLLRIAEARTALPTAVAPHLLFLLLAQARA